MTSYSVEIDYDDDGAFSAVTADVLALEWRLGMDVPYANIAAPISARITLANRDRAYSPEHASAGLLPGKPIRIRSTQGVTTRTHFTGFIERIEPQTGSLGERQAVIIARGPEADLMRQEVILPLQIDQRADQVMTAVVNAVRLRYPILNGFCLIGVAGYNQIGTARLFDGQPLPLSFQMGKSTFTYIADSWFEGLNAWEALRQLATAERGRFFINREGQAVFYNRHQTITDNTTDLTLSDAALDMQYEFGGTVVNRVRVRVVPRSLGSPASVLWTSQEALPLDPGETRVIIASYRDAAQQPIGAYNIIPPIAGVDWTANTRADGLGADRTAQATLVLRLAGATAALLEVRNNTTTRFYIPPGMTLRGTPLLREDPLLIEHSDGTSTALYGVRQAEYDLSLLSRYDEADQIARYELARRSSPRGTVRTVTLDGAGVLGLTLFNRVTISDSQTEHTADYFIVAEQHMVSAGG
ncbi:MAG: hypothetical protein JNJ61_18010, partial [Anaerolineae bacterium]|nr:hypothetical protein [Anaerolineae bacterium]